MYGPWQTDAVPTTVPLAGALVPELHPASKPAAPTRQIDILCLERSALTRRVVRETEVLDRTSKDLALMGSPCRSSHCPLRGGSSIWGRQSPWSELTSLSTGRS